MKKGTKKYKLDDFLPKFTFDEFLKKQEDLRVEKNVDKINENFEELAEYIGRELTVYEESAILDIVDEYTPKDANGDYLTGILPFDYAWEVYEAKKEMMLEQLNKLMNRQK
jgi:hypothetical protein